MERTYLYDGVLISVLDSVSREKQSDIKFLTGKVIHDNTNRFQVGKSLITLELELCGGNVFLTKEGDLFETSNSPIVTEVSCAEFLLMRINSLKLNQILAMRENRNKSKLISAFDY
ncbi:hypothetical protein [Colwellia sp. Bg11-28]|uniref:hypothetical protein n=1 Tax=Colwellia sp. Bg11-28 TaxID=2058305 RepID=UPI000C342FBE|nr:hypothetical protein [Colwellia sp. Bg11-28]PKH86876.1 hypothetical protein CXF79_09070 [Colwellia sp. Bg11-28]